MLRYSVHSMVLCVLATLISPSRQWWMADVPHVGKVAFQPDTNYKPYRNVMDYGCDNTGVQDSTACFNNAITDSGIRCGGGDVKTGGYCQSSTITPALVYVPPGTYLVSSNIIMWYNTQLVGDAGELPTIKVASNYSNELTDTRGGGLSVLDANIYIPAASGAQWYANQNNFFRQLRNFNLDMTQAPLETSGIHWQVAQATHLNNINIKMAPKSTPGNKQEGIHMENGSGGFMSDITIEGGAIGANIGSQQFTSRNLKISNSATAIRIGFDWVWLFTGLEVSGCDVGIDMTSGGFAGGAVGSVVVLDSKISAVQGILTPYAPGYSSPQSAGTLVLENVDFTGTTQAIAAAGGTTARTILAGNQKIASFAQGNAWTTAAQTLDGQIFNGTTCSFGSSSSQQPSAQEITIQQTLAPIERPSSLVDASGNWYTRSKPQYIDTPASSFKSALASGLRGDGRSDDTQAMQQFLNDCSSSGQICYFDHGAYIVTSTIEVPANIKIVGEAYSIIMGSGETGNWQDASNPSPIWRIGRPGESGNVEIQDIMWEIKGPTPGAIVVEWNVAAASQGSAGIWDAHWRIGSTAGSGLQQDRCLKKPNTPVSAGDQSVTDCTATFLLLHVTQGANGYFENIWGWVSDHELDMDTREQTTIYNGRGFLIEGDGPNWLYGTSTEHSTLYNYQWANAKNTFAGVIQTETAYFQGNPNALVPFEPDSRYDDPTFEDCTAPNCARTWGARFVNSSDIYIYGSGMYNFFENYNTPVCLGSENCQQQMVAMDGNCNNIYLWAFSTKASEYMISVNGTDLLPWSVNRASFCATVALFELAAT